MPDPLVSVVMPVYDGERYLAEAIESALAQTWERTELVVVDDGSSDRSGEIASTYPVRLLRQENRGVAAARNAGIAAARGELVGFLDQDDLYLPQKLELQVEALAAAPDAGLCVCRTEFFLEPGCERPKWAHPRMIGAEVHVWQLNSLLVRPETFAKVGTFDEGYRWCNDADWFVRASDAAVKFATLDEKLVRYRIHDDNESSRTDGMQHEQMRVFHASIQRKREAARRG